MRSELAWTGRSTTVKLGVGTSYVVSTNQVAKSAYDGSVDKQLIYVPLYSGNARLGVVRKSCSLSVGATYTGYRYTSTDNKQFLEPYWLLNATASVRIVRRPHWYADLFVNADNLLGAEYEVMLSRPMPLRSTQAGISFHFDRPPSPPPPTP
ncbi:MAG: TonB-dependent receptor [Flavobacteriales bacterium]